MKKKPEKIFLENGGQLRMGEAIKRGISRYMLYKLRDKGIIEQISRGVYRLKDLPEIGNPDLVTVSLRYPKSIVCLASALAFHGITTQIPHSVSVAVPRGSRAPSLDYPLCTRINFQRMLTLPELKHTKLMGFLLKFTIWKKQ